MSTQRKSKTVPAQKAQPIQTNSTADMGERDSRVSIQAAGGIVGATIGGMVAGPVGAVVGGLTGAIIGTSGNTAKLQSTASSSKPASITKRKRTSTKARDNQTTPHSSAKRSEAKDASAKTRLKPKSVKSSRSRAKK